MRENHTASGGLSHSWGLRKGAGSLHPLFFQIWRKNLNSELKHFIKFKMLVQEFK